MDRSRSVRLLWRADHDEPGSSPTHPVISLTAACPPPSFLQEVATLRASLRDNAAALEASEAGRKKAAEDLAKALAASEAAKAAADLVGGRRAAT